MGDDARIPEKLGPYEIRGELGRGGMGVVYRAYRPQLRREVALKVIRGDGGTAATARFVKEAQSAAKLDAHPGIVGVHDVGNTDGTLWFAMDLVEGPSFERLIDDGEVTHRRAAEVTAQAARAVHHAHVHGILHRDLKPANILVPADGPARVTDFGLARELDAGPESARITATGAILGTPAYMSPEQAVGTALDGRSDVWALGATLYEALCGGPPFTGGTIVNLLVAISRNDPDPPSRRDPTVPRDLDLIVLKCLEKRPDLRYASAAELADDLERWLEGRAVLAAPPSLGRRAARWFAHHRVAATAGLAATAVAVTAGVWWVPQLRSAEERASAAGRQASAAQAQALASLREIASARLDAALALRRADDLPGMQTHLEQVDAAAAQALDALGPHPEPLYLQGRMRRAVGDHAGALAKQSAALAVDSEFGPARYERAILAHQDYEDALDAALAELTQLAQSVIAGRPDAEARDASSEVVRSFSPNDQPVVRAVAARIADDTGVLEALPPQRRGVSEAELLVVRAIRCRLETRTVEAEPLLRRAIELDGRLAEAHEALGLVLRALSRPAEAAAVFADAAAVDRGNGRLHLLLGLTRRAVAEAASDRGAPSAELFAEAIAALTAAEARGAPPVRVLEARATAHFDAGRARSARGEDPSAAYAAAEADVKRWIALDRDDHRAHALLGWVIGNRADGAAGGDDPAPQFDRAIEAAAKACALAPNNGMYRARQGWLLSRRGDHALIRGRAPDADYAAALEALNRAVAMQPTAFEPWADRGILRIALGRRHQSAGRSAVESFTAADADLTKALRTGHRHAWVWTARCRARRLLAAAELDRGNAHPELLVQAIADGDQAVALAPGKGDGWQERGQAWDLRSNIARRLGRETDGRAAFERALADLRQAAAIDPGAADPWAALASAYQTWATRSTLQGQDPTPEVNAGIAACAEGLQRNPHDPEFRFLRAWMRKTLAGVRRADRAQCLPLLRDALDDIENICGRFPDRAPYWLEAGSLYFALGNRRIEYGEALGDAYTKAGTALDACLGINPNEYNALQVRGSLRFNRARLLDRDGAATAAHYREAMADLQKSAQLYPPYHERFTALIQKCRAAIARLETEDR